MATFRRRRTALDSLPPPPVAKALTAADARTPKGVAGLRQRSGLVLEEYDRNLQGAKAHKVWREMPDSDPIVGAVLFLLRMYLQGAEWKVHPFEAGVAQFEADAEFVESCMVDMPDPWEAVTDDLWSCLPHGWSWLEPTYKVCRGENSDPLKSSRFTDGRWRWAELAPRSQDSWRRWEFDDAGRVLGWWQAVDGRGDVLLTREKGLHFRTTRARGNPEGRSILRSAYTPWWFRKRLRELEAIGIERDLAGLPVIYVPPEVLTNPTYAATLAAYEALVKDVRADEQAGVVLPATYDERGNQLVRFELLASAGTKSHDVGAVIDRYAREIAVSVLADVVLLGHTSSGSYALSVTKDDMLRRSLQAFLDDACAVFNREELPRLFRLNGNRTGDLPYFTAAPPEAVKVDELMAALKSLADTGAPLWPSPELAEWVSERTGIPVPAGFDDLEAEDGPRSGREADDAGSVDG